MQSDHPGIRPFTCGLDATLRLISGKWKPLILFYLAHETRRYGELRRCIRDVSDKVLIQQLKELEADGVVIRTDHREVPPRVDYSLSPFGLSLAEAMRPLCRWGEENAPAIVDALVKRSGSAPALPPAGGAAAQRG